MAETFAVLRRWPDKRNTHRTFTHRTFVRGSSWCWVLILPFRAAARAEDARTVAPAAGDRRESLARHGKTEGARVAIGRRMKISERHRGTRFGSTVMGATLAAVIAGCST